MIDWLIYMTDIYAMNMTVFIGVWKFRRFFLEISPIFHRSAKIKSRESKLSPKKFREKIPPPPPSPKLSAPTIFVNLEYVWTW